MSPYSIQRAEPRYEVNARVDVGDGGAGHSVSNISLGGIGLQSPNIQDVGTVVDLHIHFPDLGGASLSVRGKVVWVNREPPMDMGIRFLDLDEENRAMLREFLRRVVIESASRAEAESAQASHASQAAWSDGDGDDGTER